MKRMVVCLVVGFLMSAVSMAQDGNSKVDEIIQKNSAEIMENMDSRLDRDVTFAQRRAGHVMHTVVVESMEGPATQVYADLEKAGTRSEAVALQSPQPAIEVESPGLAQAAR